MFYAHFVLSKKGPLSRIWLAAHWDKKLTRAQVFETNISSSVEAILEPKMKMALRTSGHLLLGVVKIFSKKTKYLFTDCSEAFVKIKMAFRPGMVDLQEGGNREAAITLPEPMMDFETTFAEMSEVNMGSYGINQSRPEDITLREDFGDIQLGRQDDDFGESAFDETGREIMRDSDNTFGYTRPSERMSIRDDFGVDDSNPFDNIGSIAEKKSMHISGINSIADNRDLDDDDNFGGDFLPHDDASNDSFGEVMILPHGDLFGDPSAQEQLDHIANEIELHMDKSKWDLEKRGGLDDSIASVMFPPTPGPSAMAEINAALGIEQSAVEHGQQNNDTEALQAMDSKADQEKIPTLKISISNTPGFSTAEAIKSSTPAVLNKNMLPPGSKHPDDTQQVTLISNDSTAFALGPIEASTIIGLESKRGKRKRRLVIDDQKTIPSEVMKIQMQDTSDITSQLDLAPPTKKLMLWKETGSVDKLFALPGRFLPCRLLQRLFFRNLITQQNPEDNGEEIFKPRRSYASQQQQQESVKDAPQGINKTVEMKDLQQEIHARHKQPLDIINETAEEMNCSSSVKSSEKLSIHGQSNNPYMSSAMCSINSNLISTPHANLMEDNVHPMNTPSINLYSDALEDHRLDTGLGAGPHGKPPCSDYEPDNDMGMVDDDDYDTDLPFEPQRSMYMGSTPMIHGLDNAEFVNLEQELAACDQEADAQVIETLKNASELTAHVQATTGDKVESLEEKRLEKRSKVMLKMLKARHDQGLDSPFSFQSMCAKNAKKQVASKFYTILLLRKQGSIHLSQETPFSEIMISQGENFLSSIEV